MASALRSRRLWRKVGLRISAAHMVARELGRKPSGKPDRRRAVRMATRSELCRTRRQRRHGDERRMVVGRRLELFDRALDALRDGLAVLARQDRSAAGGATYRVAFTIGSRSARTIRSRSKMAPARSLISATRQKQSRSTEPIVGCFKLPPILRNSISKSMRALMAMSPPFRSARKQGLSHQQCAVSHQFNVRDAGAFLRPGRHGRGRWRLQPITGALVRSGK